MVPVEDVMLVSALLDLLTLLYTRDVIKVCAVCTVDVSREMMVRRPPVLRRTCGKFRVSLTLGTCHKAWLSWLCSSD